MCLGFLAASPVCLLAGAEFCASNWVFAYSLNFNRRGALGVGVCSEIVLPACSILILVF